MLINRRGLATRTGARLHAIGILAVSVALIAACQSGAPAPAPQEQPTNAAVGPTTAPAARPKVEQQPIAGGPVLLRDGIKLRKVVDVEGGSIRIARDPASGEIFLLNPQTGLYRVKFDPPASATQAVKTTDIIPMEFLREWRLARMG